MNRLDGTKGEAEAWIRVEGLDFFHGARQVLRGVDLCFRPGRHYVVAGPNGAGKSTFLDLLAKLRKPASGTIEVMGRDAAGYGIGEFSRLLALAPQDGSCRFPFSVREMVAMGRRPHIGRWGLLGPDDWREVDAALDAFSLRPLADRAVTRLSGGESRRAVVARAVAQRTPILLLDEPTAGLDVGQALSVMSFARDLARGGALVITVSHDLHLAGLFADVGVFLKDGEVAASGDIDAVFTSEILSRVYGVPALARRDEFTGGLTASFRLRSADREHV